MSSLLVILLSSVLVSYFAVAQLRELQPFASVDVFDSAAGVAVATAIGLTVLAPASYLANQLILRPLRLDYLAPVVLVALMLLLSLAIEIGLQRHARWLPRRPGFLLLMTTQGALLGVALTGLSRAASLGQSILLGLSSGVIFALMLLAFCSLQQRLRAANVPLPFRQAPVALITVGIMALALVGLTGLIRE